MEWLTCIRQSIAYIEDHIFTVQGAEETAAHVALSPMYLQRGFQTMTGYSVGEYIRNRRLYLAALKLARTDERIIDIALTCGYETPESFTRAFTRFHGVTPSDVRRTGRGWRTFLPLKISIVIQGGEHMDYTIEKTAPLTLIGFHRDFPFERGPLDIPGFWDEVMDRHWMPRLSAGMAAETDIERAIVRHRIGEFGVCIDDIGGGRFRYMIAGRYSGGDVPEGMMLYTLPETLWAKFRCIGALPDALQSVTKQVWNEWLPVNDTYELAAPYSIEWYAQEGGTDDPDYRCAVWLPIQTKMR